MYLDMYEQSLAKLVGGVMATGHHSRLDAEFEPCSNMPTYSKQLGILRLPEHVSVNEFPARLSAASSAVASLLCFKMSLCRVRSKTTAITPVSKKTPRL